MLKYLQNTRQPASLGCTVKERICVKRLNNKVALITGANSGIGAGTALRFAQEGADLILCARRAEPLEEIARQCEVLGVKAIAIPTDVTIHADCTRAVEIAIRTFGKIDILVNCAGIVDKHRPISECSDEWWDHVIAIDQTSLFYMSKEVLPHMEQAKSGSVVNISSIGGVFGNSGIAYSSAKAAVIGMTKNIAIQYAPLGIRCNAVCPGPTPTPLNTPDQVATFCLWFAERCAQHMDMSLPEATVEDQANAILYFACDESKAVTGQVLVVDNGMTL